MWRKIKERKGSGWVQGRARCLSDKITCEQRPEGQQEESHMGLGTASQPVQLEGGGGDKAGDDCISGDYGQEEGGLLHTGNIQQ